MRFTQEYTLAYCEDMKHGEYLWYDGWLYWMKGSSVACRKMDWGELGGRAVGRRTLAPDGSVTGTGTDRADIQAYSHVRGQTKPVDSKI